MSRRRTFRDKKNVRKRILILCEGECEVNYFRGIKIDEDYKRSFTGVNVNIYQPDNYSPLGLVKEAISKKKESKREKNQFDSIWVCFDCDGHEKIPEAFRLASQKSINVIYSNICFEYWVLLHFEATSKSFRKCDDIISYLKKNHHDEYKKTDNNFKNLKDSTDIAIRHAKQIRNNIPPGENHLTVDAFTNVDMLVEYLFKLNS